MISYSNLLKNAKLLRDYHSKLSLIRFKNNSFMFENIGILSLDTFDHEIDVDIYDKHVDMPITIFRINFKKTSENLLIFPEDYILSYKYVIINLESVNFDANEEIDDTSMTLKYGRIKLSELHDKVLEKIPELITRSLRCL